MGRNSTRFNWSWLNANDVFKRCRDKYEGAAVGVKTRIRKYGHDEKGEPIYEVTYCGTALVRWYASGRVDVSSGGWTSNTTKRRLYQFGKVSQNNLKGHVILRDTSGYSRTAVIDTGEWFTLRMNADDCGLRPVGGQVTPGIINTMSKPSTSKRDPLVKLCRGDVLIAPDGAPHIADKGKNSFHLIPYFGDPADGLVRILWDDNCIEVSAMMELSLSAGGWTAGKRFKSAA